MIIPLPPASAPLVQNIPFSQAAPVAESIRATFDVSDRTVERDDPSLCKTLVKLPDGTIFWSSKMAIDADGAAAGPGRRTGTQLDPQYGQDETSFRFNSPDDDEGPSLASEAVPYIVLPGGKFRATTGLKIGDVAVVIYGNKIATAICGDSGPPKQIGEGSIALHQALAPVAPDPCERRDDGACDVIRDESIPKDVLFFAFPKSSFGFDLTPANINTKVKERALALFNKLRGTL